VSDFFIATPKNPFVQVKDCQPVAVKTITAGIAQVNFSPDFISASYPAGYLAYLIPRLTTL